MSSILAYEARLQAAAVALLTSAGATPAFGGTDTEESLPASRVVAEVTSGGRASGHMGFDRAGQPFYDHQSATLTFIVTTPITSEGVARHGVLLGLIRDTFRRGKGALQDAPYKIMRLEETSGSITYIREGERHRSELQFTVEFGIPGALV